MFATIKSLIPEPRQPEQPRHYVGRHRQQEAVSARAAVPIISSARAGTVPVVGGRPPLPSDTAVVVEVTLGDAVDEAAAADVVDAEIAEPVTLPVRRTIPAV